MGLFKNKRNNCGVKFHYQQDGYNFDITIDFGWNDNNKNYLSKEFVKKNVPVHIVFCEIPEVEPKKIYLEYGKDNKMLEFDFNKRIEHVIETWICYLKQFYPLTFGIISDEIAEEYNGRCFAKMDKSCSIQVYRFDKVEDGFWVRSSEFTLENGNVTDLCGGGGIYDYNSDEKESKACFSYIMDVDPSNGFVEVDESIYNAVSEIVDISFKKDYEISDSDRGRISNLLHFLFYRMPVSE